MDLKGSLVNTNLRIYPSDKLIEFVKTIKLSDETPHNIVQIIKPTSNSAFKCYKLQDLKPIILNSSEILNLNKIRASFDEIFVSVECNINDNHNKDTEAEEVEKEKKEKIEKKMDINNSGECDNKDAGTENQKSSKEFLNSNDLKVKDTKPFFVISDIDWLYAYIKTKRTNGEDVPYLHALLEGASIVVPENETIKRNPDLEARCVKLRAQQEAREYRKMTKSVDNVRMRFPEDSISYQMKQLNRHLIAIGQFIISIFAGFLFGFRGVEWMVGNLDFGFRLLLGVMCALVIALAEIYFLAKKLNEELCIPETVQLGGPVKLADENSYNYKNNDLISKPHQD